MTVPMLSVHLGACAKGDADQGDGHGSVRLRQRHLGAIWPQNLQRHRQLDGVAVMMLSLREGHWLMLP
jgi:hypothetical protein